jgi:putative Holliday junction resolvase
LKYLGIDHGNKRIGIAISDELGMFARPLKILEHVSRQEDALSVLKIAQENSCDAIIVGLPLDSDGGIGPRARTVNRFIEALSSLTDLSVVPWDETNSTKKAVQASLLRGEKAKKRREAMDDQAAAVILQDYLDNLVPQTGVPHERSN